MFTCVISDPPDAPRDLEIPKYDRFSATLKWKEPLSDGGNKIKGKNSGIHLYLQCCKMMNVWLYTWNEVKRAPLN